MLYSRDGEILPQNAANATGKPMHVRKRKCLRCGGQGGADAWAHTGWKCFRCDGTGDDPHPDRIRLFTAERLEDLNLQREVRLAKRAAMKAEAARIERERQAAERQEIISANVEFIARIDGELLFGESEMLTSVRNWIVDLAKEPTERQVEAVNRIIDRNQAERKRLETASHVGTIKQRRDFELTLLYSRTTQTGRFPSLYSYWNLFLDADGRKIACKSPPTSLGLVMTTPEGGKWEDRCFEPGQTVKVKATVVEHAHDKKGEPITYINRPKAS